MFTVFPSTMGSWEKIISSSVMVKSAWDGKISIGICFVVANPLISTTRIIKKYVPAVGAVN